MRLVMGGSGVLSPRVSIFGLQPVNGIRVPRFPVPNINGAPFLMMQLFSLTQSFFRVIIATLGMEHSMLSALGDLAYIQNIPGYPFRGKVPEVLDGGVRVVQMKDADQAAGVNWAGTTRTELKGKRTPDWLQKGDVLFLLRGSSNFAVCLGDVPFKAVCSPHFMLIRVTSSVLLPEFLAWQINQAPAQRHLHQEAEGTLQLSIRKAGLEGVPIEVPPLAVQQQIVSLTKAAREEAAICHKLMENREAMIRVLANQILEGNRK